MEAEEIEVGDISLRTWEQKGVLYEMFFLQFKYVFSDTQQYCCRMGSVKNWTLCSMIAKDLQCVQQNYFSNLPWGLSSENLTRGDGE